MRASSIFPLAATAFSGILAHSKDEPEGWKNPCKPFDANLTIAQYQLYPENADFDFRSCLLYIGCLFNATVAIYDPYTAKIIDNLEFPGIANNPLYHIGGVGVDEKTGLVSIVVDAGDAFNTGGQDISGTNFILQWDPESKELLYKINLTDTTHERYGGFQDVEQDPDGNVFIVGTYPGSILKVDRDGKKVTPWYISEPIVVNRTGLSGLAAKEWTLLASDVTNMSIYKFDMRAIEGTPVRVPLTPETNITQSDAIYFPPKYGGKVLLVAENDKGIAVLRSKDGEWNRAEYLGYVPNPVADGIATAPVQIGSGLYMVILFFDTPVPGSSSGNRTAFPFPDITKQVEALLNT